MAEKPNELNHEDFDKFLTSLGSLCEIMTITYSNLTKAGFSEDHAIELTKCVVNVVFNIK